MAPSAAKQGAPVVLVCGEDELGVKRRAKEIYLEWTEELGGMDHEVVDAAVSNSGEALKTLGRLREALQTLPFFGSAKVVWLQNCNFLGDERAALARDVTESLASLAQELKDFSWAGVRLLITALKVDRRKVFYKAIEKIGQVESFAAWSVDDRDWAGQAETWARKGVRARQKEISEEALAELVNRVGPSARQLDNEIEKLTLYVGPRGEIELADVAAVCTRNKAARAFALGDALGDRDLPRLLRRLDEELWEVKLDPQRSEIGLLYGLISKVRVMILVKEMLREGWIKAEAGSMARLKAQLERVPAERLPEDRRYNPQAINAYVLFKALPQAGRYTEAELIGAMQTLLECNQRLVSTDVDESLALQQAVVQIVGAGVPAGSRGQGQRP
jgi:DNA polymerase-3 subunit delta